MCNYKDKRDILSMSLAELEGICVQNGQQRFRSRQVFQWLHLHHAVSFSEMTNLPAQFRLYLEENFYISLPKIEKKLVSAIDHTVKYLYRLGDGECVECVMMEYQHGNSLCVSTQVGCRMGCRFCASTIAGFVRNLTPSEMLSQIYTSELDSGREVSSIVLMGIGEPLDNYENVLRFLHLLSSPDGRNMSLRHVSLSTCGLVAQIDALAREKLGLTLSVSLHAPNDAIRNTMMPVNRRYPVAQLMDACRRYIRSTGRRISFEYAIVAGVNDSLACAQELAARLRGMQCHVNLIPVNPVRERNYRTSQRNVIERFKRDLEQRGINVTIRRTLGADIQAACGQLRREREEGSGAD